MLRGGPGWLEEGADERGFAVHVDPALGQGVEPGLVLLAVEVAHGASVAFGRRTA